MGDTPLAMRVVEVICDLGTSESPRYRYGSGCIVAGRTVLTAGHVAAGANEVWVRGPDKVRHAATVDPDFVSWPGGPDLALLEIQDEVAPLPALDVALLERDGSSAHATEQCYAIGYPSFKERAAGLDAERETEHVLGTVPALSNLVSGLLTLHVTSSPRPLPATEAAFMRSEWSGMSGAPVMARGCLLAVITMHGPREGSSALTATPLALIGHPSNQPGWGAGLANAVDWWTRLGVSDASKLVRLQGKRDGRRSVRETVHLLQEQKLAMGITAPAATEIGSLSAHDDVVRTVDLTRSGRLLATGGEDGTVRIWTVEDTTEVERFDHVAGVCDVRFDHAGDRLATIDLEGRTRILDLSGRGSGPSPDLPVDFAGLTFGSSGWVGRRASITWSPDDRLLAVTGGEEAVVYDLEQESVLARLRHRRPGLADRFTERQGPKVTGSCFSPDGSLLATTSLDMTARLWRTDDWSLQLEVNHRVSPVPMYGNVPVWNAVFVNDGGWLVTASGRTQQTGWSCRTGKLVGKYRLGLYVVVVDRFAQCVGADQAGTRVVFGNTDGSILMWHAMKQTPLAIARHSKHPVLDIAVAGTGDVFATAGGEHMTAKIWRAPGA